MRRRAVPGGAVPGRGCGDYVRGCARRVSHFTIARSPANPVVQGVVSGGPLTRPLSRTKIIYMSPLLTPGEELRAHGNSQSSLPRVVTRLRELLGATLVAYLGGVRETRAVAQWATGACSPSTQVERRLRDALHVAEMLVEHEDKGVVRAWFQGMNPQLDDMAPARVLKEFPGYEAGPSVLAAARSFIATR